ncbi:hypothetical protein B5X24_HaOG200749 [Helicoverpa armigera]|nr:hypothetical protein B5X24_HaOG200749 [Helicoverpa armigera]
MSEIKLLTYLLHIENLLGIYRITNHHKNVKKYLITIQIFLISLLYTSVVVVEIDLNIRRVDGDDHEIDDIYLIFSSSWYINFLTSLASSVYYRSAFESYYESINRVYDWFRREKSNVTSMTKFQWCTLMFSSFTMFFNLFQPVEALFKYDFTYPLFVAYILLTVSFLKITLLFEHFVLFSIIILIVRVLKCLNHLVNAAEKRLRSQISDSECEIATKQIQEWASLYTDLANC